MKILYITTIGGTMVFFKDFIKKLLDAGLIDQSEYDEKKAEVLSRM